MYVLSYILSYVYHYHILSHIYTIGNKATVLGFIGLPYTLATYMVEGGSSKEYKEIKTLGYEQPAVLHAMLDKLAENLGT